MSALTERRPNFYLPVPALRDGANVGEQRLHSMQLQSQDAHVQDMQRRLDRSALARKFFGGHPVFPNYDEAGYSSHQQQDILSSEIINSAGRTLYGPTRLEQGIVSIEMNGQKHFLDLDRGPTIQKLEVFNVGPIGKTLSLIDQVSLQLVDHTHEHEGQTTSLPQRIKERLSSIKEFWSTQRTKESRPPLGQLRPA